MGIREMGRHWSTRKRAAGNPGGKPTNVKTFTKKT